MQLSLPLVNIHSCDAFTSERSWDYVSIYVMKYGVPERAFTPYTGIYAKGSVTV